MNSAPPRATIPKLTDLNLELETRILAIDVFDNLPLPQRFAVVA
jgi:hypothetical protein